MSITEIAGENCCDTISDMSTPEPAVLAADQVIAAVRAVAATAASNVSVRPGEYFDDDGLPTSLLGTALWCLGWEAGDFDDTFGVEGDSIGEVIAADGSQPIVGDTYQRRWLLTAEAGSDAGDRWGEIVDGLGVDVLQVAPLDAFDTEYCCACGGRLIAQARAGDLVWAHPTAGEDAWCRGGGVLAA